MVLLLALALLSSVGAQQCICDSDRTKGFWDGALCANCDVTDTPIEATSLPASGCTTLDRCRDTNRPLKERTCYGVGVCQNSEATPCNCTALNPASNLDGTYCEKCKPGFTNWPGCTTPACVEPYANSPSCGGHGACVPEAATVACGVGGLPSQCRSDLADPICSPRPYSPKYQQCAGAQSGAVVVAAVALGASACGPAVCPFGSTCGNAAQGVCCMDDEVVCQPKDQSLPAVCCHPKQTCCDGVCCDGSEGCTDIENRAFRVSEASVNTIWENGVARTLTAGQPGYSAAWGGGAWNEWKMLDGSTATPWKTCSPDYLGAVATTRVVLLPLGLTVATIVSLFLVWQTVGMNPIMVAIPAILLIFFSIFLFYSVFWTFGIVIALAALFGMGAGHKGGSAFLVALVIEFFALCVVCGGLGLGAFFYNNNLSGGQLFFGLGSAAQTAHSYTWTALADCAAYYDYFQIDPNNRAFDKDPNQVFTNYCSEGWYAYLGLVAVFVVTLQVIMVVATGVAYLKGGTGKSV